MADITISDLTPTSSVEGTLAIPTSNGTSTTRLSLNQISNFVSGNISSNSYLIEYIIVAGGGSGGSLYYAGGGGGGGIITGAEYVTPGTNLGVIVGAGGTGIPGQFLAGRSGENSSFIGRVALGGGGGGAYNAGQACGRNGGCGGGASGYGYWTSSFAGYVKSYGTPGQGFGGGIGWGYGAGGGGGAGGEGFNGIDANRGGNGGIGLRWLNGTYYGGGGAGSNYANGSTAVPQGGIGGGGNGATHLVNATAGTNGLGGGGGGTNSDTYNPNVGGAGGSGTVIIRYAGNQKAGSSGGTITTTGGFTYHTFTTVGASTFVA